MRGRGGCNREKMTDNVMSNCHLVTTFLLLQFKKVPFGGDGLLKQPCAI